MARVLLLLLLIQRNLGSFGSRVKPADFIRSKSFLNGHGEFEAFRPK